MKLKLFVYGIFGFIAVISIFIWQRDQISDLKEQVVIARNASNSNEKTVEILRDNNKKAIKEIKLSLASCNQFLIDQNQREAMINEKGKKHVKEIEDLKNKIADSGDLCLNSDIPAELRPVRR